MPVKKAKFWNVNNGEIRRELVTINELVTASF